MSTVSTSSTTSSSEEEVLLPLSSEQIATYLKDGILVVDNLLSPQELYDAQLGLVSTLKDEYDVDVHDLEGTGYRLMDASSTFGAGGVLDIFYPEWKMKIATNERLFRMTCQLWKEAYYYNGDELKDDNLTCCKGAADDYCNNSYSDNNEVKEGDDDSSFKWHPFGSFDCNRGYMYIDRIGYRIPSSLAESIGKQQHQLQTKNTSQQQPQQPTTSSTTNNKSKKKKKKKVKPIQRSLTPHFDCCPENYHDTTNKNKWRPIQCFVSLTTNLHPNTGGFEAVPGFHREFSSWAANGRKKKKETATTTAEEQQSNNISHPLPCVGEYTHLSPSYDKELMQRIKHIPVKAGSVVFWDNRIPHGNSYRNDPSPESVVDDGKNKSVLGTSGSRAVVYCSFLPDVDINRKFVQRQLVDWKEQRPPRIGDRWMKQEEEDDNVVDDATQVNDTDTRSQQQLDNDECASCYSLTDLGKRLIGIVSWI